MLRVRAQYSSGVKRILKYWRIENTARASRQPWRRVVKRCGNRHRFTIPSRSQVSKGLTATVMDRNLLISMYCAVSLMNLIVMTSQHLKSTNRAQLFRLPKHLTFHARFSASWIFCRRKSAEIYNIDKIESSRSATNPFELGNQFL